MEEKVKQHTLSVVVENNAGVLARIAGLFSGRGYNIDSLTVSPTDKNSTTSKMTIVTTVSESVMEQVEKQLNKLIEVLSVNDLTGSKFIERELILVKVKTSKETRGEIIQIVEIFKGKIVNVHPDEITIELSGSSVKIDSFLKLMDQFGIIEVARTGRVAMSREPGITQKF